MVGKRRERMAAGGDNSFVVLYTALSVILLAFFILLNSMAVPDSKRRFRALGSLGAAFGLFPGGDPNLSSPEEVPVVSSAFDRGGPDRGTVEQLIARFSRCVDELGDSEGVEVLRGHDDWTVRLEGDLIFEVQTTELSEGGRSFLRTLVPVLQSVAGPIRVEGHTDSSFLEIGGQGGPWQLSAGRAVAAMRYLVESGGVDRERLSAVGPGPYAPLADNDTEAGRGRNRRVEIVLVGLGDRLRITGEGGLEDG